MSFFYLLTGAKTSKEYLEKNQVVAANTSIMVNPASPDSTETNSARDIHHMLTPQEATQIKSTSEICSNGQSRETSSSEVPNHRSNAESAEQMPNLASAAHFPQRVNKHQMKCVTIKHIFSRLHLKLKSHTLGLIFLEYRT
jgi:hypothetical protein